MLVKGIGDHGWSRTACNSKFIASVATAQVLSDGPLSVISCVYIKLVGAEVEYRSCVFCFGAL